MSSYAKRLRTAERHRLQLARTITLYAPFAVMSVDTHDHGAMRFNVHKARELGKSLVAKAAAQANELAVFLDWTRMSGKGPENRDRGTFHSPPSRWRVTIERPATGTWALTIDGRKFETYSEVSDFNTHLAALSWVVDHSPSKQRRLVHTTRGCLFLTAHTLEISHPPDAVATVTNCGPAHEPKRGGWPGKLARDYRAEQAKQRVCPDPRCDDGALQGFNAANQAAFDNAVASGVLKAEAQVFAFQKVEPCHLCIDYAEHQADHSFVQAAALGRVGQRLLDALDGVGAWAHVDAQPSACQNCRALTRIDTKKLANMWVKIDGEDQPIVEGEHLMVVNGCTSVVVATTGVDGHSHEHVVAFGEYTRCKCQVCHGTGHNLQGRIPPIELTPQLIRRLNDARAEHLIASDRSWVARALVQYGARLPRLLSQTRVVPRCPGIRWTDPGQLSLDEKINSRGWAPYRTGHTSRSGVLHTLSLAPKWHRNTPVPYQVRADIAAMADTTPPPRPAPATIATKGYA